VHMEQKKRNITETVAIADNLFVRLPYGCLATIITYLETTTSLVGLLLSCRQLHSDIGYLCRESLECFAGLCFRLEVIPAVSAPLHYVVSLKVTKRDIGSEELTDFLNSVTPNVQRLDIEHCGCLDRSLFVGFQNATKIEYLNISCGGEFREKTFEKLVNLLTLQIDHRSVFMRGKTVSLPNSKYFPKLRSLESPFCQDSDFAAMRSLRKLDVWFRDISFNNSNIHVLSRIEVLTLRHFKFGDKLFQYLKKIQCLTLISHENVTNKMFSYENMRKLKKLGISDAFDALDYTLFRYLPALEVLHLDGRNAKMIDFSDAWFRSYVQKLKDVKLCSCHRGRRVSKQRVFEIFKVVTCSLCKQGHIGCSTCLSCCSCKKKLCQGFLERRECQGCFYRRNCWNSKSCGFQCEICKKRFCSNCDAVHVSPYRGSPSQLVWAKPSNQFYGSNYCSFCTVQSREPFSFLHK